MRLKSLVPFGDGGRDAAPPANCSACIGRSIACSTISRGASARAAAQTNLIPKIEITETDKAIEISAEMPGLERKDVEISIEDDLLTIRGEKKVEENQEKGQELSGQRAQLWRVLSRDAAAARHRPVKRPGDDVQWSPEDHHSEAGQTRAEEDRGQGSRLSPRRLTSRDVLAGPLPLPQRARPATSVECGQGEIARTRRARCIRNLRRSRHGESNWHRSRNHQLLRCRDGRKQGQGHRKCRGRPHHAVHGRLHRRWRSPGRAAGQAPEHHQSGKHGLRHQAADRSAL